MVYVLLAYAWSVLIKLSFYIWVGTLYINQKDSGERINQVSIVSNTYRHAPRLDIWLGERELDDELGEWLQGIYQRAVIYTIYIDSA
jgi:hypothetical protein